VILHSDRLDVVITPDSHEHFGCSKLEGVFSEQVRNTPEKIALLRKYLEAIFNGSKTPLVFS